MRILDDTVLATTQWLELKEKHYLHPDGTEGRWTYVERRNSQRAVVMVPLTSDSGTLIYIQQYRLPLGQHVLELPAGLVEPGESLESCAVRELLEETGYSGTVRSISGPVCPSPGLAAELMHIACMDVEEEPGSPQSLQGSEQITVLRMHPDSLEETLQQWQSSNAIVDAKLYMYLAGRQHLMRG